MGKISSWSKNNDAVNYTENRRVVKLSFNTKVLEAVNYRFKSND